MVREKYVIIDRIIEVGVYLYIIFMFLSKGEAIRNILLFGNFGLWLLTLKQRRNLYLLKQPLFFLFLAFLGSTILSAVFSINTKYSFSQLENEPLKALLLFPVLSTILADEKRLIRITYVCLFTALLILLNGYYSYIFHDIPMLKADTWLMHVWHNKFSSYLNTLLPFLFILYFIWKKPAPRIFLTVFFFFAILALILNTTRTGLLAFVIMGLIWAVFLDRSKRYNLTKAFIGLAAGILLVVSVAWFTSPYVRERVVQTRSDLATFNNRTIGWTSAIYAFSQRPLFGWGYGKLIFHQDEPFENTPIKKHPPIDDPHNTFLMVLFHQGIAGIIPYVLLILIAIYSFWKGAFRGQSIASYILIACVSVIVGNFIAYSLFNPVKFHYLAVILAFGIAAKSLNEDSHY